MYQYDLKLPTTLDRYRRFIFLQTKRYRVDSSMCISIFYMVENTGIKQIYTSSSIEKRFLWRKYMRQ